MATHAIRHAGRPFGHVKFVSIRNDSIADAVAADPLVVPDIANGVATTAFPLARLQVGTLTVGRGAVLTLNLSDGSLSLSNGAGSVLHVPALGLEDVLLTENCSSDREAAVELVLRVRASVPSGAWPGAFEGSGAVTAALVFMRLQPAVARSLLFCMCAERAHGGELLTPSSLLLLLPNRVGADLAACQASVAALCSTLRKALLRRDLLNRGWTDGAAAAAGRELLEAAPSWREKHRFASRPGFVASDAPQLRHHEWDKSKRPRVYGTRYSAPEWAQEQQLLEQQLQQQQQQQQQQQPSPANAPVKVKRPHKAREAPPVVDPAVVRLVANEELDTPAAPGEKPKTAYQLFHMHQVAALKLQFPLIKHQEAFRKAALMWSRLSASEQQKWEAVCDVHPKDGAKKKRRVTSGGPAVEDEPEPDPLPTPSNVPDGAQLPDDDDDDQNVE